MNSSCSVSASLARAVPIAWATFTTSSTVLLTRTKKVILMSARMLSRQIRPSLPERSISMVFTEMSMNSALCSTGRTTAPVKVTSTLLTFETIRALPCSTLWKRRVIMNIRPMATSSTTARSTPKPVEMTSMDSLVQMGRSGSSSASYGITQKNSPGAS